MTQCSDEKSIHPPRDWRPWVLSVSSGILTMLAFPPFNLFPLAWLSLMPLLYALGRSSVKKSFWLSWLAGFLFYMGHIHWIIPLYPFTELPILLGLLVTILASALLACYLGVYWAAFGVLVARGRRSNWYWPLIAGAYWTALEYLRAWLLTGMPWGSLGYSQWNCLPAIQIADLIGVYGLSFILVTINVALLQIIEHRDRWVRLLPLPLAVLVVTFGYGAGRLVQTPPVSEELDIALVPGNVRQIDKWRGQKRDEIFQRYLDTSRLLADNPPDLFVWPETAVPVNVFAPARVQYFSRLYEMLRQVDRPILFGTPYGINGRYYNAAFLLDAYGQQRQRYYKMHLVPFGESVPFKRWLPRSLLDRLVGSVDYDPGSELRLFEVPGKANAKIGIVICFESVFPRDFRKPIKAGANVMGILTNDSWFEGTGAPAQHYAMAPIRAVENRVPIFRCANGGISCIIDSFGRVQPQTISAPQQGIVRGRLAFRQETTLYTRFGNWLPFLCGLYVLGGILIWVGRSWVRK